ncbi:MAG: cytochrome c biogenesis protein ResB [Planctomycetes bacterium]|nr:cytochrome c biogenesis protein ResB [Planctomycetota bacterium]
MTRRPIPSTVAAALGSVRLTIALLALLLAVTCAGTLAQGRIGLYRAQRELFGSWWIVAHIGGVDVPTLPGGRLLLAALAVNLAVGGGLRLAVRVSRRAARGGWRAASRGTGVLVVHAGLLALLGAALLTGGDERHGAVELRVGDSVAACPSPGRWTLELVDVATGVRVASVPSERLESAIGGVVEAALGGSGLRAQLAGFEPNAVRRDAGLLPVEPYAEWRRNVAGCRVAVSRADGTELASGVLWGFDRAPLGFADGDRQLGLRLVRARLHLPFELRLTGFDVARHPGTPVPREILARLAVTSADGLVAAHTIAPGAPLRRDGLTIYLGSWREGDPSALLPAQVELHVVGDRPRAGFGVALGLVVVGLGAMLAAVFVTRGTGAEVAG